MLFFLIILLSIEDSNGSLLDYVNVYVGTQNTRTMSRGNLYPCIGSPFGPHCFTFQTESRYDGWIYRHGSTINELRFTHCPSPWIRDYNNFFLSFNKAIRVDSATPAYTSFHLQGVDTVTCELTGRKNVYKLRVNTTVPIAFDISISGIKSVERPGNSDQTFVKYANENAPYNFDLKMVIQSSGVKPIYRDGNKLTFSFTSNTTFTFGFSYLAIIDALGYAREYPDFSKLKTAAEEMWEKTLSKVVVEMDTEIQKKTFYSNFYRFALYPHDITEKGKYLSPFSGVIKTGGFATDIGFWDVSRAQVPLVTLVSPETANNLALGLVDAFVQSGFIPQWASPHTRECMIGNHADCAIAQALITNTTVLDVQNALKAIRGDKRQYTESAGRDGVHFFDTFGYVVPNIKYSVSKTLDYAMNDYCGYQIAKLAGNEKEMKRLKRQAMNYQFVYEPESHFFKKKMVNGQFDGLDPFRWEDGYIEGSSFSYRFSGQQDITGMINLFGKKRFDAALHEMLKLPNYFNTGGTNNLNNAMAEMKLFDMGQYAHGNEPSHHILSLFRVSENTTIVEIGERAIQKVMNVLYNPTAEGYCGDEDNGQMSAWYLFNALGFYSTMPSSGEYIIGTPLVNTAQLNWGDRSGSIKVTRISRAETSDKPLNYNNVTIHVQKVYVNGIRWTKLYFTHQVLTSGSHIEFIVGDSSNKRKLIMSDLPTSISEPFEYKSVFHTLERIKVFII
ncbi:hypothetical protein EIN_015820 [Entamoeba invadens IP1]|uniref:hypothetical protein n=1 Tax=Entamoeba invadens IP1 TaxID=370355 RepID=UPI0002C3F2DA|nr:hypothetical protein EIN_015820 [Entamoeba invadens IP1]ELP90393.1 hypothetical protein EIN_015820 [Entamoeba invadens IP1]|eukprot:XP_004257164.1 hypothetical protein EIN_015820 [Entamoeba invadens IP1]